MVAPRQQGHDDDDEDDDEDVVGRVFKQQSVGASNTRTTYTAFEIDRKQDASFRKLSASTRAYDLWGKA